MIDGSDGMAPSAGVAGLAGTACAAGWWTGSGHTTGPSVSHCPHRGLPADPPPSQRDRLDATGRSTEGKVSCRRASPGCLGRWQAARGGPWNPGIGDSCPQHVRHRQRRRRRDPMAQRSRQRSAGAQSVAKPIPCPDGSMCLYSWSPSGTRIGAAVAAQHDRHSQASRPVSSIPVCSTRTSPAGSRPAVPDAVDHDVHCHIAHAYA